jgi:hypothetical protein
MGSGGNGYDQGFGPGIGILVVSNPKQAKSVSGVLDSSASCVSTWLYQYLDIPFFPLSVKWDGYTRLSQVSTSSDGP